MLRPGLILAGIILVLDQLTKHWAMEVMRPMGVWETPFYTPQRIEILPFLDMVMAWNRGVSFGIFNNGGDWNAVILSTLSVGICIALVVWMKKAHSLPVALGLGAIIGGALGNVIDRIRFGAVADFIDVHAMGWHWPAFNLADSAITVGAIVLILDSLFQRPNSSKN